MRVRQRSSWRQHRFLYEVQEEPSHDFTSSTKDLTLSISEDNHISGTILHVVKRNISSEQFQNITRSCFSIWFEFYTWRRIPTSFPQKEISSGKRSSKPGVPRLFLTMYPFSIPIDEHVPRQHFNRYVCIHSAFRQMHMYPEDFLWQHILSWLFIDIFHIKHIMIFEKIIQWYMCKYLEIKYMPIYFALLLITLNVPLRIGKCTPRVHVPQDGNPWSKQCPP